MKHGAKSFPIHLFLEHSIPVTDNNNEHKKICKHGECMTRQ
jgi:hypothetical protein